MRRRLGSVLSVASPPFLPATFLPRLSESQTAGERQECHSSEHQTGKEPELGRAFLWHGFCEQMWPAGSVQAVFLGSQGRGLGFFCIGKSVFSHHGDLSS